jgi:two-component system, LytTR family, sensor kinase
VLVRQQKSKEAEQMLGHLGDLLRGVLEDVDAQEVSLRRELEYLQLYLAIEQVRFPDRLVVEISADPATQEASVPQMILQPIVENAIRHGIGRSSSAGRIMISVAKINGTVELRVQDDGPGLLPTDSPEDQGVGLANTRARLQQLYGHEGKLEIDNCDRGGAIVTMSIPFHRVPEEIERTYASDNLDRG